jgi:radical SAM-linked protein
MKYIGHLDVMRYFQKALRRADFHTSLSGGFSPHMIMSFAAPLGVGLTSDAEYFDLDLEDAESSAVMTEKLNRQMAPGFRVLSVREIPPVKAAKGMTLVAAADYDVRLRCGVQPKNIDEDRIRAALAEFLAQENIPVTKKTKKGERQVNIRPLIYSLNYKDGVFSMIISQGSVNNLKPELVVGAFASFIGIHVEKSDLTIHRKELFADRGEDGSRLLVPLDELGTEIIEGINS